MSSLEQGMTPRVTDCPGPACVISRPNTWLITELLPAPDAPSSSMLARATPLRRRWYSAS